MRGPRNFFAPTVLLQMSFNVGHSCRSQQCMARGNPAPQHAIVCGEAAQSFFFHKHQKRSSGPSVRL